MKIRIKGNSVRYRLTKKDVAALTNTGMIEESTSFGMSTLYYALKAKDNIETLEADFSNNRITLFVPSSFVSGWEKNEVVGCDAEMQLSATDSLYLLLEKDFACLDETHEDQRDMYENPNKSC
jgi:hypothetical protein